jgi:hypothetical protein
MSNDELEQRTLIHINVGQMFCGYLSLWNLHRPITRTLLKGRFEGAVKLRLLEAGS